MQFYLRADGATVMMHACDDCAGWPANAVLQSVSTNHGSTWGNFSLAFVLPAPPVCNKTVCSVQPVWGTPQFASSQDRTIVTALFQLFPYADMALHGVWVGNQLNIDLESLVPAFKGRGSLTRRGEDSGRIGPIVTLPGGRTLYSFEWDNFSKPDSSGQHANITIAYQDTSNSVWKLSRTQAPVGHPIVYVDGEPEVRCDGANEPTTTRLSNGTLLTLIRTQTGRLWQTLSFDNGTNLQPATETNFTSSDSPAMLLALNHPSWGSTSPPPILLLWSNCASSWPLACSAGGLSDPTGDCLYAARWALHGAISLDDGNTWRGGLEVFKDPHEQMPPRSESGDYGAAYPYGVEQADGTVIVKTGQSGTLPARWGVFRLDPHWLLQDSKYADWGTIGGWNDSTVGEPSVVTPCVYRWNLCNDPHNKNSSAPHCDRHGSGVWHTGSELCVEHTAASTQATFSWDFPSAMEGALVLSCRLSTTSSGVGFEGANISLSDYLAPSFDTDTDWNSGKFASLAVLHIGGSTQGGLLPGAAGVLPLDTWLSLTIRWAPGRFSFQIVLRDGNSSSGIWAGELAPLKQQLAMPPSYLRVRSLGAGAVCLRSANMTRSLAAFS